MRFLQFLAILLYGSYLTYAGLLFIVAPWSELWGVLIIRLPPALGSPLGAPGVRGAISAFGVLHILVAALEVRYLFADRKQA